MRGATHLGEELAGRDDAKVLEELDLALPALALLPRVPRPLEHLDVPPQLVDLVLDVGIHAERLPLVQLLEQDPRDGFAVRGLRKGEERDVELIKLGAEVGELAQLKVDAARGTVVRLVVAEGEDVEGDEGDRLFLRDRRGV